MRNKRIGLSIILLGLLAFLYPQLKAVRRDIRMFSDVGNYSNSKLNTLEYIKNIEKIIENDKTVSGNVVDVFNQDKGKVKEENSEDELIGYVYIPKIGLTYKLYNRATLEKLVYGVAVLEGSSLPNRKDENRTIIAGHNVWEGTVIFRDIKTLEHGDKVYVNSMGTNYEYEVIDFKIINQYDYESLSIVKNTNMLTLLTCIDGPKFEKRYLVNLKLTNDKKSIDLMSTKDTKDKNGKLFQNFEISPPKSPIDYLLDKNISVRQKIIRIEPYLLTITTMAVMVFVLIKIRSIKKDKKS